MFLTEIEDKISKIVKENDKENFIYNFLNAYGFAQTTIKKLRKNINNLSKISGEVHLKNRVYYKRTNNNLMQSFNDIKAKVKDLRYKPRYIMVTDFKNILAYDTQTKDTLSIPFIKLPKNFNFFLGWKGIEKVDYKKILPVDIRVAKRFVKLYDEITRENPNVNKKELNLFIIRLLFCFFAEDANIFAKKEFTNLIKELTKSDGSDLDKFFQQLFRVFNVEKDKRSAVTLSLLEDFPYIGGDLFKESHESLKFTAKSRKLIIDAGEKLEWDQINPDILGSMMQAVANKSNRDQLGIKYTSVANIMKVIKPLFLDDLRNQFEEARGDSKKLQALYNRIGNIKFMDPACGSGNFLTVTYKQLRQLEIDILKEENNLGIATMYIPSVTLDQFYGIEIDEFACETTRLSLWIAEQQMNVKLHKEIQDAVRKTLPLQSAGTIVCENALRIDWGKIIPPKNDDEIYLFGNPPYLGSRKQNKSKKADLQKAVANLENYESFDYVTGWIYKGSKFIKNKHKAYAAFVTTSSLCQGQQVDKFWPHILKMNIDIMFAYTPFKLNDATLTTGMTVVIIGLKNKDVKKEKILFSEEDQQQVQNITPYLTNNKNIIVKGAKKNLFTNWELYAGNMPDDGGGLIIEKRDIENYKEDLKNQIENDKKNKEEKIDSEEIIDSVFKKFINSKDLLNGTYKYCIWLPYFEAENDYVKQALKSPLIRERIKISKNYRLAKGKNSIAKYPWRFGEMLNSKINASDDAFLIPAITSEYRKYVPICYKNKSIISSKNNYCLIDAPMWLVGVLQSRMHMTWLRAIGGRSRNSYNYSKNIIYNTFPIPNIIDRRKNEISYVMKRIIDLRNEKGKTLADLYGSPLAPNSPRPMDPDLLKLHKKLDRIVDIAYDSNGFKNDSERLSLLLKLYERSEEVKLGK